MRSRGIYLLEFSLVTIGVVFVVVGIVDVASVLRARSAARVAVETGLRCMFPTDTECPTRLNAEQQDDGARFDVYVSTDTNQTRYGVPLYRYASDASWYSLPVRAGMVTSRPDHEPFFDLLVFQTGFPTRALATYLNQDGELPTVGGTSLNPQFNNAAPRGTFLHDVSNVGGTTTSSCGDYDGDCAIGTFEINDIDVVEGNLSKVTNRVCWKSGDPKHPCTQFDDKTSRKEGSRGGVPGFQVTQALIHITGSTFDAEPGADGAVTIQIEYPDKTILKDTVYLPLGGRRISSGGASDFVTRGLGGERVSDMSYKEIELYDGILIPINKSFKINFFLHSYNKKRIGWRADAINIYTPTYKVMEEEVECVLPATSTTAVDLAAACARDPRSAALSNVSLGAVAPVEKLVKTSSCLTQGQLNREMKNVAESGLAKMRTETRENVSCASESARGDCPEAKRFEVPVCQSSSLEDAAAEVCPSFRDKTIAHTLTEVEPSSPIEICNLQSPDTLDCQSGTFTRRQDEAERISPTGICPLTTRQTFSYPAESAPDFYTRTCESVELEQEKAVYDEMKRSVPSKINFSVVREERGIHYFETKPADPCLKVIKYEVGQPGPEMICGRDLSRAAAEACCRKVKGASCRYEQVSQSTVRNSLTRTDVLIDKAAFAAESALEAVWPGLSAPCDGGDFACSQVTFSMKDKVVAQGESSVSVPLRLLSLIPGSDTVTLSFSGSRMTEEAIALAQ